MEVWQEIAIAYGLVFLCAIPKFAYVIRKMGPNLERIVRKTGMIRFTVETGDQLVAEISKRFNNGEYPLHCAQFGPYGKFRLYMHHFLITGIVPDLDGNLIEIQEYDAGWGAKFCKPFWGRVQREKVRPDEFLHHARAIWMIPHPQRNPDGSVPAEIRGCVDKRLKWRTREPFWRLTYNNCEHYATWVTTAVHDYVSQCKIQAIFYIGSLFIFNIGSDVAAFASIFLGELCLLVWELNVIAYVEGSHFWPVCVRWVSLGPLRYRMQVFRDTQRRKRDTRRHMKAIDMALMEGDVMQPDTNCDKSMADVVAEAAEDAASALMTSPPAVDDADQRNLWRHPRAQIFIIARIQRFLSCLIMGGLTGFGAVYGHKMWNSGVPHSILAETAGAVLFLLISAIFIDPLLAATVEHTFYKYDKERIGFRTILVAILLLTFASLVFAAALGACIYWRFFDTVPSSNSTVLMDANNNITKYN